ncbi:Uncharacterised protein [Sphingomonas paucimobilis]|nr:Uncharacterised protein [Sphingomonas paucimobilis]
MGGEGDVLKFLPGTGRGTASRRLGVEGGFGKGLAQWPSPSTIR